MSFKRTFDPWSLKISALKLGIIYIKIKHELHFLASRLDKSQLSGYNGTWIIGCVTRSFISTYCELISFLSLRILVQQTHF